MSPVKVRPNRQDFAPRQVEPTVEQYFKSFNAGDFEATAALFAQDGQLHPPFEQAICGTEAIAQYLQAEAQGMQAHPQSWELEGTKSDSRRVIVKGWVKAIVFKVNAAWIFDLNEAGKIQSVRVTLLASMQELLSLRS